MSVAVVTGAAPDTGAACVRALAGAGWQVLALTPRAERLAALAEETGAEPLVADPRDVAAVAAALAGHAPDLLVNGAALDAGVEALAKAGAADIERAVASDVAALLAVTRLCLPGMIARGRGHVVNIGSVAGLYPLPPSIHGATAGAVHQFGRTLRLELRGTGVRVSEICPAGEALGSPDSAAVAVLAPEDVAAAVMFAVEAPAHVNVSLVEVQAVAQTFGGVFFDPAGGGDAR